MFVFKPKESYNLANGCDDTCNVFLAFASSISAVVNITAEETSSFRDTFSQTKLRYYHHTIHPTRLLLWTELKNKRPLANNCSLELISCDKEPVDWKRAARLPNCLSSI